MTHPAYRLSVNKSVDRYLFVELIRFAEKYQFIDMKNAAYFSLGGPFLADQKIIHTYYPYTRLVSIEEDYNTYLRQNTHKFCKNVKLIHDPVNKVIIENDFSEPAVFWLDYTCMNRQHLDDIANLASKLATTSIIKITFNSSPPYKPAEENQEEAIAKFRTKYEDYLPIFKFEQISDPKEYKLLMIETIENAIAKLQKERKNPATFVYCDIVHYCDTAPMMSISGMLISHDQKEKLIQALDEHDFFSPKEPQEINMPDFSVIERYLLNRALPSDNEDELYNALGYPLNEKEKEPFKDTKRVLKFYAKFWHKYPEFVKVLQ